MKVVVTGAAGRLGSVVARHLLQVGFDVIPTDVKPDETCPAPLQVVNLLDANAVQALLQGATSVVHLGNHAGPRKHLGSLATMQENLQMNANVFLGAILQKLGKIVFASSIQVVASVFYRDQLDIPTPRLAYLPLDSQSPANPTNAYALSKYLSEQMLEKFVTHHRIECIAIRWPAILEPKPYMMQLDPLISTKENARWAQGFSYLSPGDVARLIEAVLRTDLPGYRVYMPGVCQVAPTAIPAFLQAHYAGIPLKKPVAEISSLVDVSTIRHETGWQPGDLPTQS